MATLPAPKIFTLDQPDQIISELTYSCYRFNRQAYPETSPELWATVFGPSAAAMEARFQAESEVR